MKAKKSYWARSRSPFYSLIFSLPLFAIYEIGIITVSREDVPILRNGADVFMRQIIELFGFMGIQGVGLIAVILACVITFQQARKYRTIGIDGRILFWMLVESCGWAAGLYITLFFSESLFLTNSVKSWIHQVILSLGAGVYEEFLFRVCLISGFAALSRFIFKWESKAQVAGAVFASAFLFSIFHFIGTAGDPYSFSLLLYRTIAGVFLGLLYVTRGFGITAWAHALYDIAVLITLTAGR